MPEYIFVPEIRNLGITNCTIVSEGDVKDFGIFAGQIGGGTIIENCWVSGTITCEGKKPDIGGFAGIIHDSATIRNCRSDVKIKVKGYSRSEAFVGGFATEIFEGVTIENCSAKSEIHMTGEDCSNVGGFATEIFEGVTIENCSAKSEIHMTGEDCSNVGGFAGFIYADRSVNVKNCYSVCDIIVEGDSLVAGGFVGKMDTIPRGRYTNDVIENCYGVMSIDAPDKSYSGGFVGYDERGSAALNCFWDTDVSGLYDSDGGIGKTTAEMKIKSTFTDAGWDFENIWNIDGKTNDGYPFFREGTSSVEEEIAESDGLFISPNPASERIFLKVSAVSAVLIYDYTGTLVLEARGNEIDISDLPAGIYFVSATLGGAIKTGKFVKR